MDKMLRPPSPRALGPGSLAPHALSPARPLFVAPSTRSARLVRSIALQVPLAGGGVRVVLAVVATCYDATVPHRSALGPGRQDANLGRQPLFTVKQ